MIDKSPSRSGKRPAKRVSKNGPSKAGRPVHRHLVRQEKTAKTAAGWKFAIKRRGDYMHKYFPDSKYGSNAKALKAAKAHRDSVLAATSDVDYIFWRRSTMPETNTSGMIGVGRYAVRYKGKKQLVWDAIWVDADGKRHCRRFFVAAHGDRQAKRLARETREEAMEELRRELIRRGALFD
jgi:hypothetical protein